MLHTFCGTFLDALPHELQEELLSWEAALFHMSPSSASHWPPDKFSSSPPPPHPSCIGLGAGKHTAREDVNQEKTVTHALCDTFMRLFYIFKGKKNKANEIKCITESLNVYKMIILTSQRIYFSSPPHIVKH